MKTIVSGNLMSLLMFLIVLFAAPSCADVKDLGREVTGYRELELTVASEKVPGVVGIGNNSLTELYAVKMEGSQEWTPMCSIGGFEYVEGTEYRIRISETDYLDHSMGTPAWTERNLLEIVSEAVKASEGVPDHFIPEWFLEDRFVPEYRYASDAANMAEVDEYLEGCNPFPADGKVLLYGPGLSKWMMLDSFGNMAGKGVISRKGNESSDFPEVYRILPPAGGQVYAYMEWTFLDDKGEKEIWPPFDVVIAEASSDMKSSHMSWEFQPENFQTKQIAPRNWTPYLYADYTNDCRERFPEAGVTAAVACLELELPI